MTASQERTLAADIELATRAIPGVSALFRAGTLVSNVLEAGAWVIGIRDDSDPLIRLEQTPEGLRADIAIGVHEHVGAVETIRQVQAAVRAVVEEQHLVVADMRITVVHVSDATRRGGE
ncbi:hypothetical protein [Microbacterium sp. gxy059]|uniref:hypothetical protein n=1 Tax=Microbacterium sp. gxy059 TaxID=2957199 RepID=UPI003D96785F